MLKLKKIAKILIATIGLASLQAGFAATNPSNTTAGPNNMNEQVEKANAQMLPNSAGRPGHSSAKNKAHHASKKLQNS
jgi:hypothetical protein